MTPQEKQNLAHLEKLLDNQLAETRPESRVTKNGVCKLFIHQTCPYKEKCQYLHDMSKVQACTLYAENRCKYGASCDFSHNLGATSVGKCKNIRRNGICENENCKFKHEINPCQDYEQGYCPKGPECEKAHVKKKLCLNYQYGFCPNGPKCKDAHPKMLMLADETFFKEIDPNMTIIRCYSCQWLGHKSNNCPQKFTVEIESLCPNCKKWHYKDNKCEVDDPYYLENLAFFNQMTNKGQGNMRVPFYVHSKSTEGINANISNGHGNTTNTNTNNNNGNSTYGMSQNSNSMGIGNADNMLDGHAWEDNL